MGRLTEGNDYRMCNQDRPKVASSLGFGVAVVKRKVCYEESGYEQRKVSRNGPPVLESKAIPGDEQAHQLMGEIKLRLVEKNDKRAKYSSRTRHQWCARQHCYVTRERQE